MRQAEKNREHNRAQRSTMRTAVKKVRAAESEEAAEAALKDAEKLLDRAARKRLIHPNAAGRAKSRLHKAAKAKG
jgi:small subunit ribosomal protein S20